MYYISSIVISLCPQFPINPRFLPIRCHHLCNHPTRPENLSCLYSPYSTANTPPVAPAIPTYVTIVFRVRRPEDGWRGRELVGSSATRVTVVHRFGTGPSLMLTDMGTGKPNLRAYTSGWTSWRCWARSRSDLVATKTLGM